jgi:hypothetical protein
MALGKLVERPQPRTPSSGKCTPSALAAMATSDRELISSFVCDPETRAAASRASSKSCFVVMFFSRIWTIEIPAATAFFYDGENGFRALDEMLSRRLTLCDQVCQG